MATSTGALLTSTPTRVQSTTPPIAPPAPSVPRTLAQPCAYGLRLAGPSNGPGSADHRCDDLAQERSGWPREASVCPPAARALQLRSTLFSETRDASSAAGQRRVTALSAPDHAVACMLSRT